MPNLYDLIVLYFRRITICSLEHLQCRNTLLSTVQLIQQHEITFKSWPLHCKKKLFCLDQSGPCADQNGPCTDQNDPCVDQNGPYTDHAIDGKLYDISSTSNLMYPPF